MIRVHIRKSFTSWPRRPQRWYWIAKGPNNKTLARSEMYTNRGDCLHNAQLLFGGNDQAHIDG